MDIREVIRALSCFDKDHHIVIKFEHECRDLELEIVQIIFNGRNCVIEAEE